MALTDHSCRQWCGCVYVYVYVCVCGGARTVNNQTTVDFQSQSVSRKIGSSVTHKFYFDKMIAIYFLPKNGNDKKIEKVISFGNVFFNEFSKKLKTLHETDVVWVTEMNGIS